ncbi:MAG: lamin tail domain-containing protein [Cytophagales bacterium]|nr:lamin tail domain-containing protein [Cytophagales bacterium]
MKKAKILYWILCLATLSSFAQNYQGLKINEFFVGTRVNGANHWVEFYNQSDRPIDLKGLYFTSSNGELDMWELEESAVIDTNEYYVMFLNKVPEGNEVTAFVNLNNEENYLAVTQKVGNKYFVIDEVNYTELAQSEHSYRASIGRYPNGTGEFRLMSTKTPQFPNQKQSAKEYFAPTIMTGAKGAYGYTTARLQETPPIDVTIKPNGSYMLGAYARANFSYFNIFADINYVHRGYGYEYIIADSNQQAIYQKIIDGKQTVGALEFGMGGGINITPRINAFAGLNLGITVYGIAQYTETFKGSIRSFDDQGNEVWTYLEDVFESEPESNYQNSDIVKFNAILGLRYELLDNVHITFVYYNDVLGVNFGQEDFARSLEFHTFHLGLEIPMNVGEGIARSLF